MAWTPCFGTSGIRGIVSEELSPEFAWKIGLSVAHIFNQQPILLCHDNRTSSPLLTQAVASGLMAGGSTVYYGGEVSTPAVSFYTRHKQLPGAVLITGSHIPAHMSGIEVLGNDGAPVNRMVEKKIEQIAQAVPKPVDWRNYGSVQRVSDVGSFWVARVLDYVNQDMIRKQNYRVVLDAANGTAIPWLFEILYQLDCIVTGLHARSSPFYPGRSPNLRVNLLDKAAQLVKDTGADLGIGVDGDADRAFFIDDKGRALMGDISGSLLALVELEQHGSGTIVTPINSSNLVEDVVAQYDGKVVYGRVGPPAIVAAVKKHKALFAFEESGKAIYPNLNLLSDSGLASTHLLEHLARHETKLSTIIDSFPKYYQLKRAIDCPNDLKEAVTNHALESVKTNYPDARVDTQDGVKIIFDDGWLLLRPSGTEPVFRCFAESRQKKRAEELFSLGLDWVDDILTAPFE
ncbi:MAG: phosphoglucosamine mutase [Candidatus Hermodarchaeota archaeon]|nr:phosphoglucosamine mutase [Candidatus Hermodarchaeota archaeon]